MRSYGAQELASTAFGLAKLGQTPSAAWLDAAHRRFRRVPGTVPVAGPLPVGNGDGWFLRLCSTLCPV